MWQYIFPMFLVVVICLCFWIFLIPLNIKYGESRNKKTAINRARKLRKIGSKILPPYPNGWFAIAQSNEVKPGMSKNVDCLGENFVVFRSQTNNEVFVLDAYCPHMGANLGVGGIVKGNCIECPFHQWKFSGVDGTCVDVPYSESFAEMEMLRAKWSYFRMVSCGNEEPWTIPTFNTKGMWLHGMNEFIVHSHIQDIPENGADIAHLASVHGPSLLAGTDIRHTHNSHLSIGQHIWGAKWNADEENKHIAKIKLTHAFKFLSFKCIEIDSLIYQIGPGIVVLELEMFFGTIKILQTLTPIESLVQRLSHYFFSSPHNGPFAKFLILAETLNVARDVMIWDNKEFLRNPLLAKEEKSIKMYRNWFSQFYSENSKTFASAYKRDLEW